MKSILIIVSTCDRRDITGMTLDCLARNKSQDSDVLILDDASAEYDQAWLQRWGWPVQRLSERAGVGEMANRKFRKALEYDCTLLMDNDMLCSKDFDGKCRELWFKAGSEQATILSPYRSARHAVKERKLGWVEMLSVGGGAMFMDRDTAYRIACFVMDWTHKWDWHLCKRVDRLIAPECSWMEHIGRYGSGVNGESEDRAVDFIGAW